MNGLVITRDAVDRVIADARSWGAKRSETGAFLLAREAQPDSIDTVAIAGRSGIQRGQDVFRVSGAAIEKLFSWAADHGLRIRAQVHSHRREAFLSDTDLRHGFNVEGFITSVIPTYAQPSSEPQAWGWWQFAAGDWQSIPAPVVVPGGSAAVTFDNRDVRTT